MEYVRGRDARRRAAARAARARPGRGDRARPRRRARPRPRPGRRPPRREAGQHAAARRTARQARRPRHRRGRRPDADHAQRHRARHRRLHGARAAGGRRSGPAADVYALAAVAFEALSGRKAAPGRTPMEIAHRVATSRRPTCATPGPSAARRPPRRCKRGMAREPEDRPRSAGELAAELAAALRAPEPREPVAPTAATHEVQIFFFFFFFFFKSKSARRPAPTNEMQALQRPPAGARSLAPRRRLLVLAAAAVSRRGAEPRRKRRQKPSRADQHAGQSGAYAGASSATEAQQPPRSLRPTNRSSRKKPADQPAPTPAQAWQLNAQGFELMGQGDFAAAVPVLERGRRRMARGCAGTSSTPTLSSTSAKRSTEAGRPDEAIPDLEKRLGWDNQRATVQAELDPRAQERRTGVACRAKWPAWS